MRYQWLLIVSVALIVLGHLLERYYKGGKPSAMKRFARDLTEHPEYEEFISRKLDERSKRLKAARETPAPDPLIYPDLISDLLSDDELDCEAAEIRLEKAGASAESALLAALEDPRCHWDFADDRYSTKAPALRVAELLQRIPSTALGERLAHLVEHADWRVYSIAVCARAALGRAELLPWAMGQLESKDGIRSQKVQKGIEKSLEQGWAEPAFIDGLVDWSRRSVVDAKRPISTWAVKFYADHASEEAIAVMQSPEILSLENNRTIHFVLEELTKRQIKAPGALLQQMIEKSLGSDAKWPWNCTFRYALEAFALVDRNAAEKIAQAQLWSENEDHSRDSCRFIQAQQGLLEHWWNSPPEGFGMSAREREILSYLQDCTEVTGQVGNGGLSQYFFNSQGDNWPRAIESLRAVGCEEAAEALAQAAKVLHPSGASVDREVRMKQYAKLSEAEEEKLNDLDEHFSSARINRQMLVFMLKHVEFFRRIKRARVEAGMDGA